MPYNGSGAFSVYTPGTPFVTGTTISSTVANNVNSDFATGLSTCITKNGQTTITANLPMSNFKHTGVGAANATTDYARADQVQNSTLTYLTSVSGTDTITANAGITPAAYAVGQAFTFIPANDNTGAATLNVSGLGAGAIQRNGAALAAGDLQAGTPVEVIVSTATPVFEISGFGNALTSGAVTTSGLTMSTARLLGRTTASTGAIEEISVGAGLTLSGGSVVANAPLTKTVYTSGSGTYTTPANARALRVRMVGGGGGGAASNTNSGSNGNNTTFSTYTAGAGSAGGTSGAGSGGGAGGSATGGDVNIVGGRGSAGNPSSGASQAQGGSGGASAFGGNGGGGASGEAGQAAAANSGGGGGGAGQVSSASGGGGGAGGYVEAWITSPSASYSYAVGAGGSGGSAGGLAGGNGGSGIIIIEEYY